ncbi:hypothetical protein RJ639_002804 [Escallonia herrerae]|uniref:Uncharacterized protein n=1 Tax=Escallonia herrerae TaxID=1293975 RepID=A0AA89AXX5_9ASTE|nr:hypothetical protein RJ639_002804 [Escallonia herrerae]
MVRFSCFITNMHVHKPKKTVQLTTEAMQKALEDCSKDQTSTTFTRLTGTTSLHVIGQGDTLKNSDDNVKSFSSLECDSKSEDLKIKHDMQSDIRIHKSGNMKKSHSLGSGLDSKGRISGGNDVEDETEKGLSWAGSHDHSGLVVPAGCKDPEISLPDQSQEALPADSFRLSSDMVNNNSIFSFGEPQQSEKEGHGNSDTQFSGECSNHTPRTPPAIVKSSSLPNIVSYGHFTSAYFVRRSRSSEDLNALESRRKEMLIPESRIEAVEAIKRDDSILDNEKPTAENLRDDSYDTYNYVSSAKDWIIPEMDEVNVKNHHGESSAYRLEELPGRDFKVKRIEEWVMDLQHCGPLEETTELSADGEGESSDAVLDSSAARLDSKVTPATEAAKRYISSLSATATTAQLANHGLVVIPFLSAFASLRVLNLSGNSIVRITAGALPRGLHYLNLSKNNISTIEGLRELTRLRVLDLSYNRLLRIGHGLASCSSLKELYIAGNKISEVEGLHRLLKLNVLDLRFNKISTTKCLGQLAANYNSLQAISLEGNPAQKNVGDEQLKKYLQGLLPRLAYFNRQSIKAGSLKDATDRSARLSITAHQSDRGLRSELKTMRKGIHSSASNKMPSSSNHARKGQAVASLKPSRDKHGRLPPAGTKTATHRPLFHDLGSKLLSFRPDLAIRRSRSEGTLGAAL